jgi:hypothetical protein
MVNLHLYYMAISEIILQASTVTTNFDTYFVHELLLSLFNYDTSSQHFKFLRKAKRVKTLIFLNNQYIVR